MKKAKRKINKKIKKYQVAISYEMYSEDEFQVEVAAKTKKEAERLARKEMDIEVEFHDSSFLKISDIAYVEEVR